MSLPRPNAFGWKGLFFHALLVVAFVSAPYANLYFLLLAFLTILGGLNGYWTYRNLAGVQADLGALEPVPAGTATSVHGWIDGGSRSRFALELTVDLEGAGAVVLPCPGVAGRTDVAGALPPLRRGLYPVRRVELTSAWPLGFFTAARRLPASDELIVYAAPARLPAARGPAGALAELCGPGGAEGFVQPSGLREYRDGDDPRRIHWRASARRARPVVQEWEGGLGTGFEVVLDRRASPEALEESLSVLSALALAARGEKEILTLHSQGLSASFGAGHRPWRELLRWLASARPLPPEGEAPPRVSPAIARLPLRRGGQP